MTFSSEGKTYDVTWLDPGRGVLEAEGKRVASFTFNDGRTADWRWLPCGTGRDVRIALEAAVAAERSAR